MWKIINVLFVPDQEDKALTFSFYYNHETKERYLCGCLTNSIFDPSIHLEFLRIRGDDGDFIVPGTRLIGTIKSGVISTAFKVENKVTPSNGKKVQVAGQPSLYYISTSYVSSTGLNLAGINLVEAKSNLRKKKPKGEKKPEVNGVLEGDSSKKPLSKGAVPKQKRDTVKKVHPAPSKPKPTKVTPIKDVIGGVSELTLENRNSSSDTMAKYQKLCRSRGLDEIHAVSTVSSFTAMTDSKEVAAPELPPAASEFEVLDIDSEAGVVMDYVVLSTGSLGYSKVLLQGIGNNYLHFKDAGLRLAFSKKELS